MPRHHAHPAAQGREVPMLARIGLVFTVCLVTVACSTTKYKESADRETYGIIANKAADVPNMPETFTIDAPEPVLVEGLPRREEVESFLGPTGEVEKGAAIISLEQALHLAVNYNRQYQNQKEALYLSALRLTLERHQYAPIFSGGAGAGYTRSTRDVATPAGVDRASTIVRQIAQIPGTPGDLLSAYAGLIQQAAAVTGTDQPGTRIVDENAIDGQTNLGLDVLLAGGTRIALDLTSNFLQFLTGDPRLARNSALTASVARPLLRGAGKDIQQEALTQAERDTLYQIRDFTRFRKEFVVDIASSYYDVLRARDQVRNAWQLYEDRQRDSARQESLAEAGRISGSEVGLTSQALLQAEASWIAAVQSYGRALDQFKIDLGLTTDANIVLDDGELDVLETRGLIHPTFTDEDASKVALVARLDLYTARDSVDDAERRVVVAANALKPRLDFIGTYQVASLDNNRYYEFDFDRAIWSVGLDYDAPFDRKAERNAYRSSLINLAQSQRNLELNEDQVKLQVRQAWRDLEQAKRSYEIRQLGVQLNERRVEEEQLKFLAGLGTARDRIDAQNDLVSAKNDLIDALINHTLARLRLYRDMGILFVKEDGQWEIVDDDDVGGDSGEPGVVEDAVTPASN